MFKFNLFFKSKLSNLLLNNKQEVFFLFLSSTSITTFIMFNYKIHYSRDLFISIKPIFVKILFFKNESTCLFYTFTFLYSISMILIFYVIYLYNSGQLKSNWYLFKKFCKKRKNKNGLFFFKNGEFLLTLWLYFCICLNCCGLLLFPDYMRDGSSIQPLICGLIYRLGLLIFNQITKYRYDKKIKTNNNTLTSVIRRKRQNFYTTPHLIFYFILNYFYKKIDKFIFPTDLRDPLEIFFHPKVMTFLDYHLYNSCVVFGSASIVILFSVYIFLIFLLSFLYVITTWLICRIITSKIITHNFGDFVYDKYNRYWFGPHFKEVHKVKFELIDKTKYTWFQKSFNPVYWFFRIEYYIDKFNYRVEKFIYDHRKDHKYVGIITAIIIYFSPEFYDYVF